MFPSLTDIVMVLIQSVENRKVQIEDLLQELLFIHWLSAA